MLKTFDFEKLPIVEIVNEIIIDSVKRDASDIHFDPHEENLLIRIRVDGELINYTKIPNLYKKNLITRIKIISGMNITESRLPQDGAIKATLQDLNLDLRVSSLPTNKGEKIVIRILDYSMSSQGLEYLGFSETNFEKVKKMIAVPNGIILVTGATGSGKSTTVYSILQRLNKEEINIMTVEDPIEMNIEGINQIQVNSEIGLTFASVLRSILRQDPNIVMIGEIRDTETAQIAVRASITGHLVLSTVHTNNSLNTIERLLDMEVERYLLGTALTGIISQKLARQLCIHCRQKKETTEYEKQIFKKALGIDVNEIYVAGSCEECTSGYRGRTALQEVLLINEEIKDAITNNLRKENLRELVYGKTDTITMLQDGLIKVMNGITTMEEIYKLIEVDDDLNDANGEKIANILKQNNDASKIINKPNFSENRMKNINKNDIVLTTAEDMNKSSDNTEPNNFGETQNLFATPIDNSENFIIDPSNQSFENNHDEIISSTEIDNFENKEIIDNSFMPETNNTEIEFKPIESKEEDEIIEF